MDYFSILNLKQEPFSNSPDPDFFFHSREHQECLQKLELSILLRHTVPTADPPFCQTR
jgi:general secretion pathway protein A